jgi:predicted DNA-binding ribbon-helix-helix protein
MTDREGQVYRNIVFQVPAEVRSSLEEIATYEDRSLSSVVRMACTAYAAKRQKEMRTENEQ